MIHPRANHNPATTSFEAITASGTVIAGTVTVRSTWVDGAIVVETAVEVARARMSYP